MVDFLDKHLTKDAKNEIVKTIVRAEKMTSGEIRVHVKEECKEDVLIEAKKVFHRLQMHRTKRRNAVLIFIALKSRRLAILGDIGIHRYVGDSFWHETCDKMSSCFAKGEIQRGIMVGVLRIGEKLKVYFPLGNKDKNELSNKITEG